MTKSVSSLVDELSCCPVCGSRDLSKLAAPAVSIGVEVFAEVAQKIGISNCEQCGLAFVNPRPTTAWLERFYDREGYDCHNPDFAMAWTENDLRARFSLLNQHVKRKHLLLDFGAGAGHLLRHAMSDGWERVVGIEVGIHSRQQLQSERIRMYGSIEDAQDLIGQVDVVTMIQVLEHLESPHQTLSKVLQLLHQDGILLIEVPNSGSLRARLATSALRPFWTANVERYLAFPIHLMYFNAGSFRLLLEESGLRILNLGTLGMGVEELWRHSSEIPGVQRTHIGVAPIRERTNSTRAIRGAVKKTISRLRLGEQLIAVCSREKTT